MSGLSVARQETGRPRTRQRAHKPPPTLELPDIDDDAPERKRVLNVLAQRRYREKKRQRRLRGGLGEQKEGDVRQDQSQETTSSIRATSSSSQDESPTLNSPTSTQTVHTTENSEAGLDLDAWDPLSDTSLSNLLSSSTEDLSKFLQSEDEVQGINFSGELESMMANFTSPTNLASSSITLSSTASTSSSDAGFPDSYLLPVHELTLLRAMLRIAERIGCAEDVWKLDALSPFNLGIATPVDQLPSHWQPTSTQLIVPHHPILDFLPWPGVRDRVIELFALPEKMRPPSAAGPMALVNFVYDFEDNAEGVRIYGGDPYDAGSWEVGQVFFERWWFLFDRGVIESSNRWRRLRGAAPLALSRS